MNALILIAIACSGAAGLAYQVAWTRMITSVTSATTTAQAIVLAVFMGGLGIGAWLGGRVADRTASPLRAYAIVEVIAAALASIAPAMISGSAVLRSATGSLFVQLAAVSIALAVITTLLGATLPLVIAHVERSGGAASGIVGTIYGVNTFGAALGCLLAGFAGVERFGLSRTVWIGAGAAVFAAVLALIAAKDVPAGRRDRVDDRVEVLGAVAAFGGGFLGLAGEVLWTRLVALIVPNTIYAFTEVLLAVLIGIAIGSIATTFVKSGSAIRLAGVVTIFGGIMLGVAPLATVWFADDRVFLDELARGRSIASVAVMTLLLLPASAAIAAILPLLTVELAKKAHSFARLYAFNTLGSVAGSALMGFVMLPLFGIRAATLVLQLGALVLGVMLIAAARDRRAAVRLGALGVVTVGLLHFSHQVPRQLYEIALGDEGTILEFREGVTSHVMVSEVKATKRRLLWLNSEWVAGTGGTHRALGHVPALLLEAPKNILGIALGTGQTFSAVIQHGAQHLDCVEIDAGVIALSKKWFREANGGVLEAPNVTVRNDDGRAFLRVTETRYELVVLEPLQAWSAGTANLYSREFYEEAKRVLVPGGIVAQWIPFYGQGEAETRAMVKTGLEVFREGQLWLDGHDAILILSDERKLLALEALDARIAARGIAGSLAQLELKSAFHLASLFLMSTRELRVWSREAAVLTDDRPLLEFRAANELGRDQFVEILATVAPVMSPLGEVFMLTEDVRDAEKIRDAIVGSELTNAKVEALERGLPAATRSPSWIAHYREAVLEAASRSKQPEDVYRGALEKVPELGEAAVNLALIEVKAGRTEEARSLLEQAEKIERTREAARQLLNALPKP